MPIKVPVGLPTKEILQKEGIVTIDEACDYKIAIVNLMPTKQETELQLMRLIGSTVYKIEVELLYMKSHTSKNTSNDYLTQFYKTFDEIKDTTFDGLIITGAPVEHFEYEDVTYWDELKQIMEWSILNVTSTLHICWGAQAGLYYHYNIQKYPVGTKIFGIFPHTKKASSNIMFGFDDVFYVPQSRYTENLSSDIENADGLTILSESEQSGVYLVINEEKRQIFVTGHSEYDSETLKNEYMRDLEKGKEIEIPFNYFTDDNPSLPPIVKWRAHSILFFSNWLKHYVCK